MDYLLGVRPEDFDSLSNGKLAISQAGTWSRRHCPLEIVESVKVRIEMKALKKANSPQGEALPRVALLIETTHASSRDIFFGVVQYVKNHNQWALYHEPRGLEQSPPTWLKNWEGDGIIARINSPEIADAVRSTGLPVVDVLGEVPDSGVPLVHVDDKLIAIMAAKHLMERGFHHFGFLGIRGKNWSDDRYDGFRLPLQGSPNSIHRFDMPPYLVDSTPWEMQMDALGNWLMQLPKPIGIMVASDQVGRYLLDTCRRIQVQVPDEVGVVSVDNDEVFCEVCIPELSSVDAGHRLVGYRAAELLDQMLHGSVAPTQPLRVEPNLVIVRASSDVLATSDRHVATALRHIRELACTGLSASDLISRIPISRSVLQRRFRAETGHSIQQEIIQVRLDHARRLLAETDLPLVEVAERSGFKYREYLGAIFKAHLGKSPVEYRREVLKKK